MAPEIRRVVPAPRGPAGPHVLIADDDPSCRAALAQAFRRQGFLASGCASGTGAWATIEQRPHWSVVVLNWMLPDLDGHRIAARLRQRKSAAVVVVMIGRSCLPDACQRLDLRADYILTKPFPPAGIDRQVRRIAHRARRRPGLAGGPAGSLVCGVCRQRRRYG